ncbi:MAG: protein-glutamate O-methyltransferase CheR [Pseudomonadota bacterium]
MPAPNSYGAFGEVPPGHDAAYPLSDAEYRRFQTFFQRATGIMFSDSKRYFVQKRVSARMEALGMSSANQYMDHCESQLNAGEFQHLVNAMTVNETYFNREDFQFRTLVDELLPQIASHKSYGQSIRIWSIPCSTGEEAYSLAIWLLEEWSDVDRYNVDIVASDIDTGVLASARRGLYSQRSIQGLKPQVLSKYFVKSPTGGWLIRDELRQSITFTKVNICDAVDTRDYTNFDIVFCRNMLIYFDTESRAVALKAIRRALTADGYACFGHSDQIDRAEALFAPVRFQNSVAYQATGAQVHDPVV